jgi:hypothetical protein
MRRSSQQETAPAVSGFPLAEFAGTDLWITFGVNSQHCGDDSFGLAFVPGMLRISQD